MISPFPEALADAARLWAIRVADPAFADWDGFTAWLEGSPDHAAAYDAAVEESERMAALFATPAPIAMPVAAPAAVHPAAAPARRRWFAYGGGAVAAAAVAAVAVFTLNGPAAQPYTVTTADGQRQEIALEDGSRIRLNGGTTLRLDKAAPRSVTLVAGEALFEVKHDEARPFTVMAGDTQLLDVGTVFNVARNGDALSVGVSEGAVIYNPKRDAVRLDPGATLNVARDGGKPVVTRVTPDTIGSWTGGRLVYADAPLAAVARDLTRNLGRPVTLKGGAGARFTGILTLEGSPDAVLPRIAPLLGVDARRDGEGWTLTPTDGARR